MTHRAESILEAFKGKVTSLTTTGANVVRDQVYPAEQYPSLSVDLGAEDPASEPNSSFQDSELQIEVVIRVKSEAYSADINKIKAEVYEAIKAQESLGLAYVISTTWRGDDKPNLSSAETPTAECTMKFSVQYRHSYLSKEA